MRKLNFFKIPLALVLFCTFCTIKAPLITFTQTQTASEKQMLGEDRNLEKDGWLIASIKTSSSGSEIWERDLVREEFSDPDDRTLYIALRTLAYLARETKEYSASGLLAEGLDGKIRINPKAREAGAEKALSKPELKSRLDELLKITNESRDLIVQGKLRKETSLPGKPMTEKEKAELKRSLLLSWYRSVGQGEYYESSSGIWKKKG
ncbi:DUF1318 domain-containing protein [Leptospira inadai]|uniref:DUF1318 domain-containing protein n=1 Tax=Leptospira inadai serovar Lyme TaxID=293084 RepID=A0ABX4YJ28_9LEPT|nr:DUF1318 domain-containing protein [Leptospira inadai]PNV75264.1 DUF1318 domain-containing protein [Leptospira inadai serovar Lyme]